jgi:beta-glucanase (GH16 family)
MKRLLLLLFLLKSFLPDAHAQGRLNLSNYTLVASDDFNYSNLSQLIAGGMWQPLPYTHSPTPGQGFFPLDQNTYECTSDNISFQNGILRLAAKPLPGNATSPNGKRFTGSGLVLTLTIDPPAGPCDWNPADWLPGMQFGAVEIRCKLPNKSGAWPAAWMPNPDTEFDLIDNSSTTPHTRLSSGVLDWRKRNSYAAANPQKPDPGLGYYTCGGITSKEATNGSLDLSQDFNIYTVVWTPDYVSFFLNGKEQYTVPSSTVRTNYLSVASHSISSCKYPNNHQNGYHSNSTIRLDMGVKNDPQHNNVLTSEAYMYIDYVKIYKPNAGSNANDYYQHSQAYSNYEVRSTNKLEFVSPVPGAIGVNQANPNEIFFRGTDNALYRGTRSLGNAKNNQWSTTAVDLNQGSSNSSWLVAGDVLFNSTHDVVNYLGADGKIQQYSCYQDTGHTWAYHHKWVDNTPPTGATPISTPRSIAIASNGDIYYIGIDHKIHFYHQESGEWTHFLLPYSYSNADLALGDLLVQDGPYGEDIYYKGVNNQAQLLYYEYCPPFIGRTLPSTQQRIRPADHNPRPYYAWAHENLDTSLSTTTQVASAAGSLTVSADKNVIYIGADGDLHRYYGYHYWTHEKPVTTSAAAVTDAARPPVPPVGAFASKPHPQSTITWDAAGQQAIYVGIDGRLQSLYNTSKTANAAGSWTNAWVDDFFNNTEFISLLPVAQGATATPSIPSIKAGSNGDIFYRNYNNQLRYFVKTNSQYIRTDCSDFVLTPTSFVPVNTNELKSSATSRNIAAHSNPPTESLTIPGGW